MAKDKKMPHQTAPDRLGKYVAYLTKWISDQVSKAHAQGAVVGISGGVDSALVAALAVKALGKERVMGVNISIDSQPLDLQLARKVAESLGIRLHELELKDAFNAWHKAVQGVSKQVGGKTVVGNAKARFRMVSLYAFAQANYALVLGTDNADEMYTGYFTKHGDGAADILPIVRLTKDQVRKAARTLGVPEDVVVRTPTASLWAGQTDEQEMGLSYEQLDAYLLGYPVPAAVKRAIEALHERSEHKRKPAPQPKPLSRLLKK